MKKELIVNKKEFSTYFEYSREDIVDLTRSTDAHSIELRESIRTMLKFELQKLYVSRIFESSSIIYLHDLVGAFLGCDDVIVKE